MSGSQDVEFTTETWRNGEVGEREWGRESRESFSHRVPLHDKTGGAKKTPDPLGGPSTKSRRLAALLILFALFAFQLLRFSTPAFADEPEISGELRRWHRVTITFTGPKTSEDADPNPFRDIRLTVIFRHEETGSSYRVPGFFAVDGNAGESGATAGDKWRVHFAPPQAGRWTWQASFRVGKDVVFSDAADAGKAFIFRGPAGSFPVGESDKKQPDFRAQGRLSYVGKHYLQFAQSKRFFIKAGADSPENFLAYVDFDGTYSAKGGAKPKKGEALARGLHRYDPHVRDWNRGDPLWQKSKGKGIIGAINYFWTLANCDFKVDLCVSSVGQCQMWCC